MYHPPRNRRRGRESHRYTYFTFGQGERVSQMETSVHVGEWKSGHEFFHVAIGRCVDLVQFLVGPSFLYVFFDLAEKLYFERSLSLDGGLCTEMEACGLNT